MEEENLFEYEGVSYPESSLRDIYPDDFDKYVEQGILTKVGGEEPVEVEGTQEESLYEYEGVSYPESSLREAYPDTFDDYVEQGVLTKVDSLGKPIAVEDSAAATDMDLVSEDGFLGFAREVEKPKYIINGKEVNRAYLNDNLYKSDFVDKLQEGTVDVEVFNDPKLEELLKRQAESGNQWGDKIEAFNSGLSTLASGVVGAPGFIVDVFEEITGVEADIDAIDYLDELSEDLSKKAEELNNQQRAYKDDFIGSISEGNILDAVNIGFNTVANSAPIMVAAGLTGGAGGVAGALTSAATMSAIMIPAEYASTKISEDEKIKELSDGDKLTRAFFRGGAEGAFEGLMGPVGARSFSLFKDGVKNLIKTTAKESGAEAAKEVAEGMGKKTALEVFKTFGISTAAEGGSEALTALSQDLTDDYLGIQDLSVEEYMRNASEAAALGVFMGGVTTGALGGAGQVMSYLPLRNEKVYQGAKTEVREKQESGEINNEEAKQMDDAIESAKVALDKTDPSLSEENQEKVAKLIDERERIKIEIEGLDDNQVPVQNKKNRIEEINKEISEIGIEKPSTEEETGVQPTPEEPVSAETATAEEEAKEEIKLSDSELSTESVYNKNVEEDNEDFIKGSNEFKDKAVNYDEGINDPKFIEENTVKEEVDVNDIIPTQNKLFKKSLNNKSTESPILIKVGNKYYVEDGHHRIADKIMSGGGKLNATVYNSTPLETAPAEEQEATGQEVEKVAKIAGVKAKNIRGLYDINRKMFGQNRVKSLASAVVMDRAIGQMAKREGVPKSEMYSKIQFEKGVKAPDGSLKQESLTFKSTAKEGLGNIQQKSATPEQWVKMIADKGGKGTIQELEWIGLNDFLQDYKKENKVKSIPKEVVEQYINDNQIEIVEVTKGKKVKPFKISEFEWALQDEDGNRVLPNDSFGTKELAEERIKGQNLGGDYGTKYSEYTLEGGENYREVLLTLPQEKGQDYAEKMRMKYGENLDPMQIYEKMSESERETQAKLNNESEVAYKSSHWDESNILAHLRINERTLPNGERVLFIEEVQSDWAQEGKKEGFYEGEKNLVGVEPKKGRTLNNVEGWYWEGVNQSPTIYKDNDLEFNQYSVEYYDNESTFDNKRFKEFNSFKEALDFAQNQPLPQKEKGVPQMPYKKTDQWVGMAMRRAMQMAAQEGFDRIAWVTGEQSADRYDLSKQVDTVGYNGKKDGTYDVVVKDFGGRDLLNKNMTIDEIESTLGKEVANKIQSNEHGDDISTTDAFERQIWEENGYVTEGVLEGENLKVGGEGMKAFYNSILPKVAKKEAQRFDPETFNKDYKAEVVEIEQKKKDDRYKKLIEKKKEFQDKADKSSGFVRDGYLEDVKRTQRSIDKEYKSSQQLSIPITPKMRMNLNGAVPLFQGEQGAMLAQDGNYIIYALTNPNVSTPLHELAHVYEHYLTDTERKQILNWAGKSKWDTSVSEKFARGFEKYLAEGKAPNSKLQKIFDKLKEWLTDIYNGIKGSDIDIELNDKMRSIYDQMLSEEQSKEVARKKSAKPKPKRRSKTQVQKAIDEFVDKKIPSTDKVSMSEKQALNKQIRDFARGVREAYKDQENFKKKVNKLISDNFKLSGNLTPSKVIALTRRALEVSSSKPKSLDKFIDYAAKLEQMTEDNVRKDILKRVIRDIAPKKLKKTVGGVLKGKIANYEGKVLSSIRNAIKEDSVDSLQNSIDELENKQAQGIKLSEKEIFLLQVAKISNNLLSGDLKKTLEAEDKIKALIKDGKSKYREDIQKRATEYERLVIESLPAITGGKKLTDQFGKLEQGAKRRPLTEGIREKLSGFLDYGEGLRTLLDKIDRTAQRDESGYGGVLDKELYEPVADGRREKDSLDTSKINELSDKLTKLYGKKKKKALRDNQKPKNLGTFTDRKGNEVKLFLSQNQAYPLYQYMQDPSNMATFESMGFTDEMLQAVEDFLTPEIKEWADWQMSEFFPKYYDQINAVYKDMNDIDLPKQKIYVPIIRNLEGFNEKEVGVDEITFGNPQSTYKSLKQRQSSKAPFDMTKDGNEKLMEYTEGMNRYIAFAKPVKRLNVVFKNKDVRNAIREFNSTETLKAIDGFIERIANNSSNLGQRIALLDKIRGNVTIASLALAPTVTIKQLTSIPAYAADIPISKFISGLGAFAKNPKKVADILMESEYMQKRYKDGFERDILDGMKRDYDSMLKGTSNLKNKMMFLIKWGDKGAILMGGYSVYKYHFDKSRAEGKSIGESKKIALSKFEEATKLSQQSTNPEDLSQFQSMGSLGKLFTMYMTSPISYFRQERKSARDFVKGYQFGNKKLMRNAVKRFTIYHFVLPLVFQYVASGLPGLLTDWDEEDEKDLMRAASIGSLNGVFIAGQLISYFGDILTDKAWVRGGKFSPSPAFDAIVNIMNQSEDVISEWNKNPDKFSDDLMKEMIDLGFSVDVAVGLPVNRVKKLIENWKTIADDNDLETREEIALGLGFSPYVVTPKKKSKRTERFKKSTRQPKKSTRQSK